jgi:hypothetical protein
MRPTGTASRNQFNPPTVASTVPRAGRCGPIALAGAVALALVAGVGKRAGADPLPSKPAPSATAAQALPAATVKRIGAVTLFPQACSSRTLIGIDPYRNVAYVPVYSLDRSGNAQVAVVNLAPGARSPVLKLISLTGSVQPMAMAYNPSNRTMLADARRADGHVRIYEIDTAAASVSHVVEATGLIETPEGPVKNIWGPVRIQLAAGGMVEDLLTNQAIAAGTTTVGLLDTAHSPPVWDANSVISLDLNTESFAVNARTGLLFISNMGSDALVDTRHKPLKEIAFSRVPNAGVTDGIAFDIATNIALHAEFDGSDQSYAVNFDTLDFAQRPAVADAVAVPGLGFVPTVGPVPGGQAAINCATHQAVVADGFGPNFRVIQLPAGRVAGPLNNRGQPASGTVADAASVYTVAAAAIPAGEFGGPQAIMAIVGDPSSLTVDPLHNLAYMLADDGVFYHRWNPGTARPLFLVRVDLSKPVFGAGPAGGADGKTFWKPAIDLIRMP